MASDGSRGPKPWKQRHAKTLFLRVPAADFPLVARGRKTEFRSASGMVSGLHFVEPPTPVVAYMEKRGKYESKLMVLEERRTEPLGAISEESLRNEGFATLAEFRRYWMRRERRRFRPTRDVVVYRVRPFEQSDAEWFARKLIEHLYGEWWLPAP